MPLMQPSILSQGLTPAPLDNGPDSQLSQQNMPPPLADDRSADLLEAHSVKWNVARIVRLSSGRFALLTHYSAGALDIIKVGTIEEIVDYIPNAAQCEPVKSVRSPAPTQSRKSGGLSELLADIGLNLKES